MAVISANKVLTSSARLTIFLIVSAFSLALQLADNSGFNIELIHRNAPNSPFFNSSETSFLRSTNALQRSVNRVNHFSRALDSSNSPQSVVSSGVGDYLMKLSIGTPPVEMLACADTGSDLIWTQCKPCVNCFAQSSPLFDPKASSSYKRNVSCYSSQCKSLAGEASCVSNACRYSYEYGDSSFTEGVLATETIILGSPNGQPVSLPDTTIGCGTNNQGNFDGTGIVGLGHGKLSLISRMDQLIDGKFSYCLVPYFSNRSSKMNFGDRSLVSGPDVVSTPILSGNPITFYYLKLEAISVEDKRLEFSNSSAALQKANIIIDSGTTLTYLPEGLYNQFRTEMRKVIHLEPVDDPTNSSRLCYSAKTAIDAPVVTVHFTGAEVKLDALNLFYGMNDDVVCLAFDAAEAVSVYGNVQQMNFMISYDLKGMTLSFKRTDCTAN